MSLNDILLFIAALAPATVLGVYIFKKDRAEKEPPGLLMMLLALGAAACLPAGGLEHLLTGVNESIFSLFATETDDGLALSDGMYFIYNLIKNVLCIGLVEEGLKWAVLLLVTRNNKNFNSLFDGVVYAVFVSLGFAAFENVMYVLNIGWRAAFLRAFLSVPGHMFFAVIMGMHYSWWHAFRNAKKLEKHLIAQNAVSPRGMEFPYRRHLVRSIVVPTVIHGVYDFCCTMGSAFYTLCLYAIVIGLYLYCFRLVRKMSMMDRDDDSVAMAIVANAYPAVAQALRDAAAEDPPTPAAAAPAPQPARRPAAGLPVGHLYVNCGNANVNGRQTYYLPNGDVYAGEMRAGLAQGWGTYYCSDGRQITGMWVNGRTY